PWRWRLARLWRRRWVRRAATVQLPALALAACAALLASDPHIHAAIWGRVASAREALTARPEFAIRQIEVEGAQPAVRAEILASLTDAMGASSLRLDAAAVRRRVESLGWVQTARVSLEAPATLRVHVVQREAAAVWRIDGEPVLIDANGAVIEPAFSRADHPDLPLVAGEGAAKAVGEALAILAVAGPLQPRIRGLIRVGQRRWDVALDRDMVLMLPAAAPVVAMTEAVALQRRDGLFDRDLAVVDLRIPDRPTLRLTERGLRALNGPLPGEDA
ncbi:MAG: cell division protein FtsQ/DivIB, partial [Rubrimonas sp.]